MNIHSMLIVVRQTKIYIYITIVLDGGGIPSKTETAPAYQLDLSHDGKTLALHAKTPAFDLPALPSVSLASTDVGRTSSLPTHSPQVVTWRHVETYIFFWVYHSIIGSLQKCCW